MTAHDENIGSRRVDETTRQSIYSLFKGGYDLETVAEKVGFSSFTVKYWLVKNGMWQRKFKRTSNVRKQLIYTMHDRKATINDIAHTIGISRNTVSYWLQHRKATPSRNGQPTPVSQEPLPEVPQVVNAPVIAMEAHDDLFVDEVFKAVLLLRRIKDKDILKSVVSFITAHKF